MEGATAAHKQIPRDSRARRSSHESEKACRRQGAVTASRLQRGDTLKASMSSQRSFWPGYSNSRSTHEGRVETSTGRRTQGSTRGRRSRLVLQHQALATASHAPPAPSREAATGGAAPPHPPRRHRHCPVVQTTETGGRREPAADTAPATHYTRPQGLHLPLARARAVAKTTREPPAQSCHPHTPPRRINVPSMMRWGHGSRLWSTSCIPLRTRQVSPYEATGVAQPAGGG